MWKLNGTFAIFGLLSFFQLHNANAVLKYLEQSYFYPLKQVMYNEYSFKEGNLVYAACSGNASEVNCTLVQRRFPDDSVTRSCNLTLKVMHPQNINLTRVSVLAFGSERAILFWGEIGTRGALILAIIRLDNCKMKELRMRDSDQSYYLQQISTHKILIYNTSFDMFFDIQHVNTQHLKRARIRFDQELNMDFDNVTKTEDGATRFISPIATRSPDKGYVYSTSKNLWLVKTDGTQKLLANYENKLASISAGYDAVTSCVYLEIHSETSCTQYDQNGNIKFNITLDIGAGRVIIRQIVYNTPRGGFLLVTAWIRMLGVGANLHMKPHCEVDRVNDQGKYVRSIRLRGFMERIKNATTYSIWESKDQYCAASIGQVGRDTSLAVNLDVAVACFTEDDFKA